MVNKNQIKKGDNVTVIIKVWRDDELPTIQNFYTGKITQIVERSKDRFYVRIKGLDRLIPIDRISFLSDVRFDG